MNSTLTLSKSEFKLATSCFRKLYYYKNGYPKTTDDNDFIEMLAEGGYMVGALTTLLFDNGVDINKDTTYSKDKTENTLKWLVSNEKIVLFEAAFKTADGRNCRVDILEKIGNTINVLEIKAKSWDSKVYKLEGKSEKNEMTGEYISKNVTTEFKPYLEDVIFQTLIVQEVLGSQYNVHPFLVLPDKSKSTTIEGLNGLFDIKKLPLTEKGFKGYDVSFTGSISELKADNLMYRVDISSFYEKNHAEVLERSEEMLKYMIADFNDSELSEEENKIVIGGKCKKCEYRLKDEQGTKNGYKECWSDLAYVDNHFFNLTQFGNIFKGVNKQLELASLIANKTVTINDIPDDLFYAAEKKVKKGELPPPRELAYNGRPYYQKTEKEEFINPEMANILSELEYPLYFIDFETSRMALPYHKGMRPYEVVAYQWSIHTIGEKNKPIDKNKWHTEWLNVKDSFPNSEFVRTLYKKIKGKGTILIWSSYEKSILTEILNQYEKYKNNDNKLSDEILNWLREWSLLELADFDLSKSLKVIDMEKLANKYYFHPYTNGRTSIKPTLPAAINAAQSPIIKDWLETFTDSINLYKEENGAIINPYNLLPALPITTISVEKTETDEDNTAVAGSDDYYIKEGGAAMRAYQDMMYGFAKNDEAKKKTIEDGLKKYCQLDTLAMVIIWHHWKTHFGLV
jgi:hypothetical protein